MNRHLITLYLLVLFFYFIGHACAVTSSNDLNTAEKFVIKQLNDGKKADLRKLQEDNRIIRASFLEEILTERLPYLKEPEKKAIIIGAIIKEKLDFHKNYFPFEVHLYKCIFDKDVDFSYTEFSKNVYFLSSEFYGYANFKNAKFFDYTGFNRAKFLGNSNFSGAIFYSYANFNWAEFSNYTNFSKVEFTHTADFNKAKFSGKADFQKVKFCNEAEFEEAKFSMDAIFWDAQFFDHANFRMAKFHGLAVFSDTEFIDSANFRFSEFPGRVGFYNTRFYGRATFGEAKFFRDAVFTKTKFYGETDFKRADLNNADMSNTYLNKADLGEANLSGCLLWDVHGFPLNYEPRAGSPPYIPSFANFSDLSKLTFKNSPHGLVDLREGFKKLGYREQERAITYAIKHRQRVKLLKDSGSGISDKLESLFYYFFFELTCKYGMNPGRPLIILVCLIPFFSIFYTIALKTKDKKTGIWLIFLNERVLKSTGKDRPFLLTANFPPKPLPIGNLKKNKLRISRWFRIIRIAIYFSLISAFSIGWRELNIGNWITRLQRREYVLRATGWIRTISGIQSLTSVYLLALWVLTYFGRPFEGI